MLKQSIIISGLFLLFSLSSLSQAWLQEVQWALNLQVGIVDPTAPNKPIKRVPTKAPSLCLYDHTLYLITSCDGYTLQLINEDGDIEYNIIIPENTSTITLPFYLSGGYELRIIRGNYYFFEYVEL